MTRFLNYLNEIHNINPNIGIIDDPNFINEVKINCSAALKKAKEGYIIYRGFGWKNMKNTYIFKKSERKPRVSANTYNYYTLFIDNSLEWSKFPKRSMGLICTSSARLKASLYGIPFVVLPENNARIGICPLGDIWMPFDQKIYKLNKDNRNIFENNHITDTEFFNNFLKASKISENREEFLKQLNMPINKISGKYNYGNELLLFLQKRFNTWKKLLESIFSSNNFDVKTIENYNVKSNEKTSGQEVWTDATCYLIKASLFDEYVKKGIL